MILCVNWWWVLVSNAGTALEASILDMEEDLLRRSLDILLYFLLGTTMVFVAHGLGWMLLIFLSRQSIPAKILGLMGLRLLISS